MILLTSVMLSHASGWRVSVTNSEPLIRIKNGLYRPVPLSGLKDEKGKPVYMFVRVGEVSATEQ